MVRIYLGQMNLDYPVTECYYIVKYGCENEHISAAWVTFTGLFFLSLTGII